MRILLVGGTGFLGGYLHRALSVDHEVVATSRSGSAGGLLPLDVTSDADVDLLRGNWDLVVHAAGFVDADACEREPEIAFLVNVDGTERLARAAAAKVVFFSTDYVFDGARERYTENDEARPVNVYGASKLAAERALLGLSPRSLVVRLPFLYGTSPVRDAFLDRLARPRVVAPHPLVCNPLYLGDVAPAMVRMLGLHGVVHLGGSSVVTRRHLYDRAREVLELPCEVRSEAPEVLYRGRALRPARSVIVSVRTGEVGRDLGSGLAATRREIEASRSLA